MHYSARFEVLNLAIDGLERRLPRLKRPSAIAYWDACLAEARIMLGEVREHMRAANDAANKAANVRAHAKKGK